MLMATLNRSPQDMVNDRGLLGNKDLYAAVFRRVEGSLLPR